MTPCTQPTDEQRAAECAPCLLSRGQFHLMPGQSRTEALSTLRLLRRLKWASRREPGEETRLLAGGSN